MFKSKEVKESAEYLALEKKHDKYVEEYEKRIQNVRESSIKNVEKLEWKQEQERERLKFANDKKEEELRSTYQKKLFEAEAKWNKQIGELKVEQAEELAEAKTTANEGAMSKMQEYMAKVNIEGTQQAKFAQELSLKMFDKAPVPTTRTEHMLEHKGVIINELVQEKGKEGSQGEKTVTAS